MAYTKVPIGTLSRFMLGAVMHHPLESYNIIHWTKLGSTAAAMIWWIPWTSNLIHTGVHWNDCRQLLITYIYHLQNKVDSCHGIGRQMISGSRIYSMYLCGDEFYDGEYIINRSNSNNWN